MTGSHIGPRRPWWRRRHPAEKLADQLRDAFVTYYDQLSDDELRAIQVTRTALHAVTVLDRADA